MRAAARMNGVVKPQAMPTMRKPIQYLKIEGAGSGEAVGSSIILQRRSLRCIIDLNGVDVCIMFCYFGERSTVHRKVVKGGPRPQVSERADQVIVTIFIWDYCNPNLLAYKVAIAVQL